MDTRNERCTRKLLYEWVTYVFAKNTCFIFLFLLSLGTYFRFPVICMTNGGI